MSSYEDYLNGLQQKVQKQNRLESVLGEAANTNPDEFANMVKLSKAAQISVDVVPEYKDIANQAKLLRDVNANTMLETSPKTSNFLLSPNNAKTVGDDINNLKDMEAKYGTIKPIERTWTEAFTDPFTRGYRQFESIWAQTIQDTGIFKGLEQKKADAAAAGGVSYDPKIDYAVRMGQLKRREEQFQTPIDIQDEMAQISNAKTFGEAFTAIRRNPRAVGEITMQSAGTFAPVLAVAAAATVAGPTGPSTVIPFFTQQALRRAGTTAIGSYLIEYGSTLDEVMSSTGADMKDPNAIYKIITDDKLMEGARDKATKRGIPVAFFDALTAGLAGKLLSGAKPAAGSIAARVAGEGALQMAGGAGGEAAAQAVTGEFKPGDILLEAVAELPTALIEVPGNYKSTMHDAKRAEAVANVVQEMNDLSKANRTRTRDVDTFKQFIDQVSEDGPVQNVYISADALRQSGNAADLSKLSSVVASQVEGALATNGEVQIPIDEYMATIAPSEVSGRIIDDLRVEGETMTRREAREFIEKKSEELQASMNQALEKEKTNDIFIKSAKEVETNMFDQLKSTGVYTAAASKNFATYVRDIYVTKAAAMGITPSELYDMIPYKITSNMPGPEVQLFSQDGQVNLDTEAFKSFYGNSVFKDDQGAPVLLYHGTADNVTKFDVNHPNRKDSGWLGTGVYLTDKADMANLYADQKARSLGPKGQNVMPLYARLENPYYATAEDKARVRAGGRPASDAFSADLQAQGYDGVIFQPTDEVKEIVVFDPAAVKSKFNSGLWSKENDLLAQKQKAKSDVTQHVLMAERGERTTGKIARISDAEKAIIDAAAKKLGIKSDEILKLVKNNKLSNPQKDGWAPLELTKIKIEPAKNGKAAKYELQYQVVPYTFANGANDKIMQKGTPEYNKKVKAIGRRIHDEVLGVFNRAQAGDKAAQNIIRQAGWYKEMRSRLRQEFGGLGDVFADLLGATSPNTPVRENWKNAVDVLRRATKGDFDTLMPKWVEWASKVEQGEAEFGAWFGQQIEAGRSKANITDEVGLAAFVKTQKKTGLTLKEIKLLPEYQKLSEELNNTEYYKRLNAVTKLREISDDLLPTKESGKKYGFNGRNALRALLGLWRVVKDPNADLAIGGTAPKALNFSGNLIGFRERATIDVWAARLLQRLSGGIRIPSMAESGVTGNMLSSGETTLQFGFGQDVFTEAVKNIRADTQMQAEDRLANMNDDDLQAVVWFLEKEVWTKNNWTSAAGEGGSFEYEADLTGQRDLVELTKLRKIMDSSKSTPEQKAAAADQINALARTVDRYTGGISIQQDVGTQGIDFVPTDADMARLGEDIKTSIYQDDDGATVLGSKALSTEGRYGNPERSLDLEVVVREGFNPLPMWRKMLEAARDANQDSTFLSKVLREDEQVDYQRHRPGVEIYFREAGAIDKLQPILDDLAAKGVQFYTVIVDGKRSPGAMAGAMPDAVGVRLQYVPEMNARYGMDDFNWSDLTVEEISTKMKEKTIELENLADEISSQVEGVSFAGRFWYETEVAFKNQYQEKIDAITDRTIKGKRGQAGSQGWRGESILAGVKNADNWARESELQAGAEVQPSGELLAQRGIPTTDQRTGLDLNPDGTVTLYHHTSADAAGAIKRSSQLVSAGEPSVYLTTRREADIGYGDTVVTVRVNPDRLNVDDEFPNGRQDYRIDVGQPGGAIPVLVGEYKAILNQPSRGGFDPKSLTTILTKESDYSTFIHETTHFYLDMITQLAAMPNAPQSFVDDLNTVLEWAGATPEEWTAWNQEFQDTGKMNEGMRKVHEAFAYNSEIYISTGTAPSVKMQTMFDQFAAWLRRVYKSIREELNVIYKEEYGEDLPIMTGEVKQVMDRMLASEEEIEQAQTVRGMVPIYLTQAQSGMDDATWAAYQAMSKEAKDQSVSDLTAASLRQMRWLSNAKSKMFKEMQKETAETRKEVRDQVAKDIETEPVFKALRWLKYGEMTMPDGEEVKVSAGNKLKLDDVKALYPESGTGLQSSPDIKKLGFGQYGMLAAEGLNPDLAADMFGFTSGDQLVRSLVDAPSLKEAIDTRTDQRMLEEYGDMYDAKSRELAVERALHNEARARFVTAELRHAAKATQPVRIMLAAARQAARNIIGNKLVRDTKASEYSAAETRSTRQAEKAMKAGDADAVTQALQNRLLNNQLTSEATKASQEIDKGLKYFRKVQSDASRKRVGADYSEQIDQLLERFELRPISLREVDKRTTLAKWIENQRAAGYEPEISPEMEAEANRKSYRNMTVSEFRDLVSTIQQIEHMGRTEQNMLTSAKEVAYKQAKEEIVEGINENANGRVATARTPTTDLGRYAQTLKRFWASHIKAATIARIMDGGKDGGKMWEYFIRTANNRGDMETEMRAKATKSLTKIMAPIFATGKMGGNGKFFASVGRSFNKESQIAIALNVGNEGNTQRLLGGEGWSMSQVMPILESLTEKELQAVQKIWDYFETYRPMIAEKERKLYGKEPKWIEPRSITIKSADGTDVTLRGGYYPIKYDPVASQRAETNADAEDAKRMLQGAYTSATTKRSFTKGRVEEVKGRPLLYTMAGMYSGINDVIHDLSWHEWLIDANKLLRSQSIDEAIRSQYGPEFKEQLKTWVNDVAVGEQMAQNAGEMALGRLRQGISAAGLGFNVMSALQQVTGFNQSIVRVGARYIGRGISKTIANPRAAFKEVNEKSSFMANRSRTQFRELNELRNMVQDESQTMRAVKLGAYYMMMRMQRLVDVPTWYGAYEKGIGQGHDEETSIALADQAVIDSQGGGMVKDLSAIERGGPGLKLFTVYYSFMNTAFNLAAMKGMTAKSKGKLAADYLMLFVVPVVLTYALKAAVTPSKDDDDWDWEKIAKDLAAEQLSYVMGTMVVLREFGEAAKVVTGAEGGARDYSGPAGLRLISDSYKFLKQAGQFEFDDAFRKAAINLLGDITGLPSAQANRTITGINALAEGETENPAAIVLGFKKK